jgi:hypothetical protein
MSTLEVANAANSHGKAPGVAQKGEGPLVAGRLDVGRGTPASTGVLKRFIELQRLDKEQNIRTDNGLIRAKRIWQKGPITIWENLNEKDGGQRFILLILQIDSRHSPASERLPRTVEPNIERNTRWFYGRADFNLVCAVADELYQQFLGKVWDKKTVPYNRTEGMPANWPLATAEGGNGTARAQEVAAV